LQPRITIPVFIASPGDVDEERKIATEAIQQVSSRLMKHSGISLAPVKWEQFAPISSSDAKHPQHRINQSIEPFSIFIGILYRRYGTKIKEMSDVSGTESEFNHAIANRNTINILTYFRDQKREDMSSMTDEDMRQIQQVGRLQERLKNENVFYQKYLNAEAFKDRIALDIYDAFMQRTFIPENRKIDDYAKFFAFGDNPVLIVHPLINITRIGNDDDNFIRNWRKHLLPTVAAEDSNAIREIRDTLGMLKKTSKVIVAHSSEIDYISDSDTVWICVGSNKRASKILNKLGEQVNFTFTMDYENTKEKHIVWKSKDNPNIIVRSPLAKYLSFSDRPEGEDLKWRNNYGNTYARDYAVLARFKVFSEKDDSSFYHYFLGGIRGLGTWGAAWYVQNFPAKIGKLIENNEIGDNIQILLEVTYRNYKIESVKDVSNENQKFFDQNFSDQNIEKQYKEQMEE
jgi:hypothetical protein